MGIDTHNVRRRLAQVTRVVHELIASPRAPRGTARARVVDLASPTADIAIVRATGSAAAARGIVWLAQDVQTKAMWCALAAELRAHDLYPVLIAFTLQDAEAYAAAIPPDVPITIVLMQDYYAHIVAGGDDSLSDRDLESELVRREQQHGVSIMRALALSDRHLGRDLMTGARGFARSKISERRSRRAIGEAALISFRFWETLARRFKPDLVLTYAGGGGLPGRPLACVLRELAVPYRNMSFARFGDRFYWAEDEFAFAERFAAHHASMPEPTDADIAATSRAVGPQVLTSPEIVASLKRSQTWLGLGKFLVHTTARHLYGQLRGYAKSQRGYLLGSLLASSIRAHIHRGWLGRNAERSLAKVGSRKVVYHALQVEPEITTTLFGEFASDQLALVRDMALALPADAVLLVKEHPWQVGRRDLDFYRRIRALPNAVLMHPDYPSIDLIRRSSAVSTGCSSVAYEGAVLGIPAFHTQERSLLDVVPHAVALRRRTDIEVVRAALADDRQATQDRRRRDGARFYAALMSFGFGVGDHGLIRRATAPSREEMSALLSDLDASLDSGLSTLGRRKAAA